ncbi:MAG TPA: diguanylate cyclase, partial [Candidatus Omnitrophota bacterium]|nr:diguanylate cyclase [Candidatus Omnitrophota bacterium]
MITERKNKRKTTLFLRILLGLTSPLLVLAIAFSAIELTNKMNALNEFYKIESRFAFESIQKTLAIELKKEENYSNLDEFLKKLERIENFHHIDPIDIYSVFERQPLIERSREPWLSDDFKGMESSLYQKQLGKNFEVHVDKPSRKLIAYIPVEGLSENQIFVVRVKFPLARIVEAIEKSAVTLLVMFFLILMTGIFIGRALSKYIVDPIQTLIKATQEIKEGHLGELVEIHTGDEIEVLAHTFNRMSEALKTMKERAEDSNPLTQLPGNQGIFHELKKRIYEKQKFVLFHIDLDRFKVFNDHFGLAKGDEAIKGTAETLKRVVKEKGAEDDFVGHQGGDDFVVITRPNRAVQIAEQIIHYFDKEVVPALYPKKDYEQGFTMQIDRRRLAETGEERLVEFPLISVSLAGVSNAKRDFADYFD